MLARIPSTRTLIFTLGVVALLIGMALLTTPVSAETFEPTEGLLVVHVTYDMKPGATPPLTLVQITRFEGESIMGRINPDGYFSIFLPPGSYFVDLRAKGFGAFFQKGITIQVGQTTTLPAHLIPLP